MEIKLEHLNALRVGTILVAEVQASGPDRRAWVSIYPMKDDLDDQARREGWKRSTQDRTFNVHHQEFGVVHIEQDLDMMNNDGLWHLASTVAVGEQALLSLLREWGVPPDALEYPWDTDYPL